MELSLSLSRVYEFSPSLNLGLGHLGLFFSSELCERYYLPMADDVVHVMENMKLTTEEEEVISISNEGRLEAIEDGWKPLRTAPSI